MSITSEKQQNKEIRSVWEPTPQLCLFTYLRDVRGILKVSKHTLLEIICSPLMIEKINFITICIVDKLYIEGIVFKSQFDWRSRRNDFRRHFRYYKSACFIYLFLKLNLLRTLLTYVHVNSSLARNDTIEVLDLSWNKIRVPGAIAISFGLSVSRDIMIIWKQSKILPKPYELVCS